MQRVSWNLSLYRLAWGLLICWLFIVVFGSYLMPHSVGDEARILLEHHVVNGNLQFVSPPFPPSTRFWLGTDHRGYDLLSLFLNGGRYTIGIVFLITFVRFLIGLPLGLVSGTTNRGKKLILLLQMITSSVPPLLFLFPTLYGLVMALHLRDGLSPNDPRIALFDQILVILMIVFGTFQIAHQFSLRAEFFRNKLFVVVAKTMGASTMRIIFKHILPQLRAELLFAFLSEFVQVLFLLGQLAVLNIFMGGGDRVQLDQSTFVYLSKTGEWSAMIAYGMRYIRTAPWILIGAGLFLTISVMILLFFSSQLKNNMEHPAVYRYKSIRNDKPIWSVFGVGVAAALVLLTIGSSKAPTAVAVSQNISANQATVEQKTNSIKSAAQEFMQALEKNDKSTAMSLLARSSRADDPLPKPFDNWIQLLHAQKYEFSSFGTVTPPNATQKDWKVEVKMKSPQQATTVWYLFCNNNGLVIGGEGNAS